jgi:hypothetical protein
MWKEAACPTSTYFHDICSDVFKERHKELLCLGTEIQTWDLQNMKQDFPVPTAALRSVWR